MTTTELVMLALLGLLLLGVISLGMRLSALRSEIEVASSRAFTDRDRISGPLYLPVMRAIANAESMAQVELSWGAREMLAIPVIETTRFNEADWEEIEKSIRTVIDAAKDEAISVGFQKRLDSLDIIRGFLKKFCNIPPFCKRR